MKMKMRRLGMSAIALLVALTAMITTTGVSHATGSACQGNACVRIVGTGTYVETVGGQPNGRSFFGHYHFVGGGIDHNTADQNNPNYLIRYIRVNRHLPNQTPVCAEAWEKVGTGYVLIGRPCLVVHS